MAQEGVIELSMKRVLATLVYMFTLLLALVTLACECTPLPAPLGTVTVLDETGQQVTLNHYPESSVIGELLKSSNEFKLFYQAEREKVVEPILWVQDPSLQYNEAVTNRRKTEEGIVDLIRLRRIPAVPEDAFMIAHEMEGCVLNEEGFIGVIPTDSKAQSLAGAFNSMVWTPLRDSRLERYGFDLQRDYETRVNKVYGILGEQSPEDPLVKLKWEFFYVQYLLYWQDTLHQGNNSESEFQSWFDKRYPELVKEGQEIFNLVNETGYDTPEKMKSLLIQIYDGYHPKYGLHDLMVIVLQWE